MASDRQMRKPETAAELLARLNRDPEYLRRKAEREAEHARRAEALRQAEQPIVADLRTAGCDVASVWDLVNTSVPYPDALPVLLEHLGRGGYPDWVLASLGRALAVPASSLVWPRLRELYLRSQGPAEMEGLAVALAASATVEHLDQLVDLLDADSRGESRIHLLSAIARVGGWRVLEARKNDPVLGKEAAALLKGRR